jgi:SNF2 family DNA or RNA helicase
MELLEHQKKGIEIITQAFNKGHGFFLGDSAGTGKTLQALIPARKFTFTGSICLWITLASAKLQLPEEIERFSLEFKPLVLIGSKTERLNDLRRVQHGEVDLLVINYEQLLSHAEDLAKLPISVIICDEATRLGNQKNKSYKKLFSLARYTKAKLLCMSGSPITNSPLEAYALFDYLNPNCLGSWFTFARTYMGATPFSMVGYIRKNMLPHLANRLQPYYLRREREVLLPELPELMETTIPIELSPVERKLYTQFVQALLLDMEKPSIDKIEKPHTSGDSIVRFARLRQLCVDPGIIGTGNTQSSKLNALKEFIGTINGSKALIFTEFASAVPAILAILPTDSALCITGQTPQDKRNEIVQRFQTDPGIKYLCGTKAVEMALNLQAADYVIHIDPPLTYSSYDQRCSRARRNGRKDKVISVRLVMKRKFIN